MNPTLELIGLFHDEIKKQFPELVRTYIKNDIADNDKGTLRQSYSIDIGELEIDGTARRREFSLTLTRGAPQIHNDGATRERTIAKLINLGDDIVSHLNKNISDKYRFYLANATAPENVGDNPDYFFIVYGFTHVYNGKRERC